MNILIAGASRGIGKYLASGLAGDGYRVHGTYHETSGIGDLAYSMTRVNVNDESQIQKWINEIDFKDDRETVLINCVGINYNAMLHKSDTQAWTQVINTNLLSSYMLIKHVLPLMRQNKYGRLILLSSVVPIIGVPGTSAYSASKAAIWGLISAISAENAKYGITANSINLGYFNIGMISDVPESALAGIKSSIPSGELGDPVNILECVRFIIKADYLNRSQIDLNGGLI